MQVELYDYPSTILLGEVRFPGVKGRLPCGQGGLDSIQCDDDKYSGDVIVW